MHMFYMRKMNSLVKIMKTLTIRGIDKNLSEMIKKTAQMNNVSINKWVLTKIKEATGIVLKESSVEASFDWPILSFFISRLFNGSSVDTLKNLHIGFFWTHWAIVLFVLVFIGYSRYLHIFAAPLNIALRSFRPSGALRPVRFEANEPFGVSGIEDFSRKQLLESLSCVACGRCQDACPAFSTGKSLNPKEIVRNIKARLLVDAPLFDEKKESLHKLLPISACSPGVFLSLAILCPLSQRIRWQDGTRGRSRSPRT